MREVEDYINNNFMSHSGSHAPSSKHHEQDPAISRNRVPPIAIASSTSYRQKGGSITGKSRKAGGRVNGWPRGAVQPFTSLKQSRGPPATGRRTLSARINGVSARDGYGVWAITTVK